HRGEARVLQQHPPAKTNIVQQAFHRAQQISAMRSWELIRVDDYRSSEFLPLVSMTVKARKNYAEGNLAERVGFEPTIRFPVYTLSKRAPSATRPSLPEGRLRTRRELPHLLFYRIELGSHGCGVWVGAEVVLLYCGPGHRI